MARNRAAASCINRQPVRDVPGPEEWAALLARSGIARETTVVLYGDNNNWFAAFAYWLVKVYGHEDARLMNGGRRKWMDEGRPLSTEVPRHPVATYRVAHVDATLRALRDEVREAVTHPNAVLVDVRSPGEFSGELLGYPTVRSYDGSWTEWGSLVGAPVEVGC